MSVQKSILCKIKSEIQIEMPSIIHLSTVWEHTNQTRKHSGALTILLPLLQALNSLEVLVF